MKQLVNVRIAGKRGVVFEDMLVRVRDDFNACLTENNEMAEILL